MAGRSLLVHSTASAFGEAIEAGPHRLLADEPLEAGGADAGPNPYELLLAALGSCTAMTIQLYARRRQWPLERVDVELTHARTYGDDCEHCPDEERRLERIERRIALAGALTPEQRQRLLEIAERCPVHRTLTGRLDITTTLVVP